MRRLLKLLNLQIRFSTKQKIVVETVFDLKRKNKNVGLPLKERFANESIKDLLSFLFDIFYKNGKEYFTILILL